MEKRQALPLEDRRYTGTVEAGETYVSHLSAHLDELVVRARCTTLTGHQAEMVVVQAPETYGTWGGVGSQFSVTRRSDGTWCQTLRWSFSNHPRYLVNR